MRIRGWIPALLMTAILLIPGAGAAEKSEKDDKNFDVISDVDLGFLMTQPKFPWGEDPFLRKPGFADAGKDQEKFTLSGILFGQRFPLAVVNGKKVEEGDRVGSRMVKQIGPNFVILKKKDSEIELTLPPLQDEIPDEDSVEEDEEAK
ncbi:MAG: hypothetical protein EBX52_06380 [Proteobacteria bacterium]|nr:hypothetical protein [Pseudomonadota bacterium]